MLWLFIILPMNRRGHFEIIRVARRKRHLLPSEKGRQSRILCVFAGSNNLKPDGEEVQPVVEHDLQFSGRVWRRRVPHVEPEGGLVDAAAALDQLGHEAGALVKCECQGVSPLLETNTMKECRETRENCSLSTGVEGKGSILHWVWVDHGCCEGFIYL